MAKISIQRTHQLGLAQAREAINQVGQDLASSYQLSQEWQGNTLRVKRSGLEGTIAVSDRDVQIDLQLGLLLSAAQGAIKQAIHAELERRLGG